MSAVATHIASRFAPLSVVVRDGVVIAAGYRALDGLLERVIASYPGLDVKQVSSQATSVKSVAEVVRRYDDGDIYAYDTVALSQPGGEFMQQAWAALRAVPAGTVVSYAELAARAGRPAAVRAAGTACASNLVAPFVPCHRVVRTGGNVGNYGFGVELKRTLLEFERSHA